MNSKCRLSVPIDFFGFQNLFALANDTDVEVKKQLCRGLTLLLDSYIQHMGPHLDNIIQYMLLRTQVCLGHTRGAEPGFSLVR